MPRPARARARLVDVEHAPKVAPLARLLPQLLHKALLRALRDLLRVREAPAAPPVRAAHLHDHERVESVGAASVFDFSTLLRALRYHSLRVRRVIATLP